MVLCLFKIRYKLIKRVICCILLLVLIIMSSGCNFFPLSHKPKQYHEIDNFHEGLAWVRNDEYIGCIDESGKMLFKYKNESHPVYDFENGRAFLYSGSSICMIDKSGKTIKVYSDLKAHGYGFAIAEKDNSGFDSTEYVYEIYNEKGDLVKEISNYDKTQTMGVSYIGDGVFMFDEYGFYFAKTKKLIKAMDYEHENDNLNVEKVYYFNNEGKTIIKINGECYYAKSTGEIKSIPSYNKVVGREQDFYLNGDTSYNYFNDGHQNSYLELSTYNVETNCISKLNDKAILKRLNTVHGTGTWEQDLDEASINKNGIIVNLNGDDDYSYVAVLDKKLKTIIKPVSKSGKFHALINGNYYLNNAVYNKLGKKLFDISFDKVISDSENVTIVADYENTKCKNGDTYYDNQAFYAINKNGDILFEGINDSSAVTKSFP